MRKTNVLEIKKIIGPRPLGGARARCAPPLDPLVDIVWSSKSVVYCWIYFVDKKKNKNEKQTMQLEKPRFQQPSILLQNNDIDSKDLCTVVAFRSSVIIQWVLHLYQHRKLVSIVQNKNKTDTE